MKLAIVGQGQLAQVTAICCKPYFEQVQPKDADVLWVCYDTPLKVNDAPDVEWVMRQMMTDFLTTNPAAKVLVSSPIRVGTIARLEQMYPQYPFAYSPENIRVAHGVEDFKHQTRIVIGRRTPAYDDTWQILFDPFCSNLIFTDPETAEMCKHALNAYLAMSVAFANEIDRLCKVTGADSAIVTQALLTERRISSQAPLHPGAPYSGGHLARDLHVLTNLHKGVPIPLLKAIKESNDVR